ncbi:Periostin [Leucoagaricus sp. SymC.cos]|nr:Periostin [Leucoagaricus sp. SymC.cos]
MRLVLSLALAALSLAAQIPVSIQSTTLVDVLGQHKEFECVLKLLQRARLIPTLNKLNGSTFFAPTNDAIHRHKQSSSLWASMLDDDTFVITDNVQEQLRQQLFYHLLNYSIADMATAEDKVETLKTLHYPHKPIDPPGRQPPPYPPWMPVPSGTLGGEPQRLRAVLNSSEDKRHVGVDAFGKGGSEIVKGRIDGGNGVIFGIDDVLVPPPDLASVVSAQQSLSYLRRILTPESAHFLNITSELTLFLPVDKAWDEINPYERIYLESEFAADDLKRILNMHAVVEKGVKWSDSFVKGLNLTTLDGTTVEVATTPEGQTTVATGELIQPDIYAANGVLHLISSLLIPEGALQITPEKYLLAFNCTSFVSLLRSVNLTDLIQDTEKKYTILAPKDDVLSIFGDNELPEKGSPELRKALQYHFIPGHWPAKKLYDRMLLETALEEEGLDGRRQVLAVDVNHGTDKGASTSIGFEGAGVIGDPVEVDNILIYFVSQPLTPPSDALSTALPNIDLSAFLVAILSSSQSEVLKTTPRTSLLLPLNSAFKRLGTLVSAHLLSATPSSKLDLEKVLLHHTISDVVYAQTLVNGSQQTYSTLEGSDIKLTHTSDGSVLISPSGGWPGMKSRLIPTNTLTQTGVIHELTDILLPRSVELTVGKLVRAAKGNTMMNMVNRAGFDWILNGTLPPEESEWFEKFGGNSGAGNVGWILLCPGDEAFKHVNLTELFADEARLKATVMQHLIPSPFPNFHDEMYNNQPLSIENSATYSTLRSTESFYGDIVFKVVNGGGEDGGEKQVIVRIKDARGTNGKNDWAKVAGWGRATKSGVIQIDRLLSPYEPPWYIAYGAPAFVGVIGMIGICGFFYGVSIVWGWDTREATYEPVGGYGQEDDEEA